MAIKFEDVIQSINSADEPLTATTIYRLSDISAADLYRLQTAWGAISVERRLLLVQRLSEVAETNFDMNFSSVIRLAMTDLNPDVREAAIEGAWMDELPEMLNRLLPLTRDMEPTVRAASVSAIGHFILLGELGKFDDGLTRLAQNVALRLYKDDKEPITVRRRGLEAISNCSLPEVNGLITEAYASKNPQMRASAVFAMGRSCDEQQWGVTVLRELKSDNPEMRYEAARSAGELELDQAVGTLGKMIVREDREVQEMAIWALGEIGGSTARHMLEDLIEHAEEKEDEGLVEAIREALEAASLVGENLLID